MDYFNYKRRVSSVANIGDTPLGGANPVRVQTMASVSTMDTEAAVQQAIRMIDAGAEYVRFTAQGEREARNLGEIRRLLDQRNYRTPLVADIHFNPRAADVAATTVEKVRINPGNYVDKQKTFSHIEYTDEEYAAELEKIRERFAPFLKVCKAQGTAVRIGVNHGSLSDRIMSRYGDTPQGMVASCMEFLRICREEDFSDVVISMKASNTVLMVRAVRLLIRTMEAEGMAYPLHLGVTEAGDGEDGRIKSAVGIGTLLADGIGDTIRVSLSEEPEVEVPVGKKLVAYIEQRKGHLPIVAQAASGFDPVTAERHRSRSVNGVGFPHPPIVISDRRNGSFSVDENAKPDYFYTGSLILENFPSGVRRILDATVWKGETDTYPYFTAKEWKDAASCYAELKFVQISYEDLSKEMLAFLKEDKTVVVMLTSEHSNGVGHLRAAMHRLLIADCDVPVVLNRNYVESDKEALQLESASDFGALFLDGFGDGIFLQDENVDLHSVDNCMFGILQATRTRTSKTEFISCPGCGRTLYNLQATIARVKAATSHLKGLKIGIMGCIVNGPGEMADADYGYVGAGKSRISLYKGKTCVVKSVPEEEAVERLVQLIKENGDWQN
ncbi:MAG: 4-hydroxy-3-methylbut-2-en-1-yl diphosphate synthase [Massilibacteroides sp.]|nr:4-hydroxy-3-methylbut-2-en-1-yl diphosphate synthase [Massilibacteroides sp.]MDD3062060.1 4-hydroxy-3-methylbut-2-en-1-yl diphosphate synthase [Massilibacteroides sp.]MDD4115454.1 4-hydroxy-3-methylbut-2-en-1-yl diphosphate synthase [Massilibacteroides sp.]MDD4659604.1 4-hydroxy-3-methylbut-2-en-1-yl diphosphate synthase [Massilibacteroides sp.]